MEPKASQHGPSRRQPPPCRPLPLQLIPICTVSLHFPASLPLRDASRPADRVPRPFAVGGGTRVTPPFPTHCALRRACEPNRPARWGIPRPARRPQIPLPSAFRSLLPLLGSLVGLTAHSPHLGPPNRRGHPVRPSSVTEESSVFPVSSGGRWRPVHWPGGHVQAYRWMYACFNNKVAPLSRPTQAYD